MRAAGNSTTSIGGGGGGDSVNGGFGHWNTPIPYLFGGLGIMMGLITIALIILACSYKKSLTGSGPENEEKSGKQIGGMTKREMEPKVVVIMAGDENPTYLAMPKHVSLPASVSSCTCQSGPDQV